MKENSFNTLNHCVYKTKYHLVIVTKYRRKVINKAILERLYVLCHERASAWSATIEEINGEPDHLHILMEFPPKFAISDFVNALKTGTSRRIKNEFPEHVKKFLWKEAFWSRSFCVVTCGGASLEVVKNYIHNQKGV